MESKHYDVVVVGGGMAGLTASAYCARSGLSVLLCEKQERLGGLVNSFERNGFVYDQGIRAIENSGIIFPMLKQLGIELPFVHSPVTLQICDERLLIEDIHSLDGYQEMLCRLYPESEGDICAIMAEIRKITGYMQVLYGIDNPLFMDNFQDLQYVFSKLFPFLFKSIHTMSKIKKLQEPVTSFLSKFTSNQALIDIIAQHFFADTPTFFALSYFGLYLEYQYPLGGTGALVQAMEQYLKEKGVVLLPAYSVTSVDAENRLVNEEFSYTHLIWAADLKHLYRCLKQPLPQRQAQLEAQKGGDSIFTFYMACSLPSAYFAEKSSPHLFYTPTKKGLGVVPLTALDPSCKERTVIEQYLISYLENTTFEISLPVLRDPSLAPEGCSALLVSCLFSYELTRRIENLGWYEEAKHLCEQTILRVLSENLYPELSSHLLESFSSTPTTLERLTANSEGAITGWAFTGGAIPVIHTMQEITKSVRTELDVISQAGQWAFSPSGLPISVMTGKLASDRAIKAVKQAHNG